MGIHPSAVSSAHVSRKGNIVNIVTLITRRRQGDTYHCTAYDRRGTPLAEWGECALTHGRGGECMCNGMWSYWGVPRLLCHDDDLEAVGRVLTYG